MMQDLELSPAVFSILSGLIEERIGFQYELNDLDLLRGKVSIRAQEAGFDSLLDYYYFLRYDPNGEQELAELIEALVVGETYFFREWTSLKTLVTSFIEPWCSEGRRPRIWSAACSTGEEPLSLAMLLDERNLLNQVEIVATDISRNALTKAKQGRFGRRSVRQVPEDQLLESYIQKEGESGYRVAQHLVGAIQWNELNLFSREGFGHLGQFDAIICRNVLIYFSDSKIQFLLKEMAQSLSDDGVLIVGASESLLRYGSGFIGEEKRGRFHVFESAHAMSQRIRVLVIDDSAFARKVVREVLEKDSDIEVIGIARDGIEALEKIGELKPDVITLDLIMPELDGMGVLQALPGENPPRVVIVSVSGSDTELAIRALQSGAAELVTKPTPLPTDRLYELSSELVTKVKAAAAAKSMKGSVQPIEPTKALPDSEAVARLVVVGTSTGGPQALTQLLTALPSGIPVPIIIALHIPQGYTEAMAARMNESSALHVVEAYEGMVFEPGQAAIAPGGMHLKVRKQGDQLVASVSREPLNSLHHPSVDILFESAAAEVGDGVLGLVLTGMGNDGLSGAEAIVKAGGRILAESEGSCVVYGMPRSVIEAGYCSGEALLPKLPKLLVEFIYS